MTDDQSGLQYAKVLYTLAPTTPKARAEAWLDDPAVKQSIRDAHAAMKPATPKESSAMAIEIEQVEATAQLEGLGIDMHSAFNAGREALIKGCREERLRAEKAEAEIERLQERRDDWCAAMTENHDLWRENGRLVVAIDNHLTWLERFICNSDELDSTTPRKVAQNAQDAAAELRAALVGGEGQ